MNPPNSDNETNNSVILATGGYDNSIRFWSVHTGMFLVFNFLNLLFRTLELYLELYLKLYFRKSQ